MNRAEAYYADYEDPELNPIQRAQNKFVADPRPSDSSVPPEDRKHGLAQGFLLNNEKQDPDGPVGKDLRGRPVNQETGKLFVMPSVKESKRIYAEISGEDPDHDRYLNPGDPELKVLEQLVREVTFGEEGRDMTTKLTPENVNPSRILTVPLPGMVEAFKEGVKLLKSKHPKLDTVLLGSNGYGGYMGTLKPLFPHVKTYRHATDDHKFNFEALKAEIEAIDDSERLLLLMQSSNYNYTGVNPTSEENQQIVDLATERGIQILVDSAYQGLGNGFDEDVEIVRMLAKTDLPFSVYHSFSKSAQLYGQRIGFMHFATGNPEQAQTLRKNMYAQLRLRKLAVPVNFKMITPLLNDPALRKRWIKHDLPAAGNIIRGTKENLPLV